MWEWISDFPSNMGGAISIILDPSIDNKAILHLSKSTEHIPIATIKESRLVESNTTDAAQFKDMMLTDGVRPSRSQSDSLHSRSHSQELHQMISKEEFQAASLSNLLDAKLTKVLDADGRQRAYSHDSTTKPMNAAVLAMQKRRNNRGSNSSLGSRKGSAQGSNVSLTEFFADGGKKKESSSSIKQDPSNGSSPSHHSTEKMMRKEEVLKAEVQPPKKHQHASLEQLEIEKVNLGETEKRRRKIAEYRMKKFNSTSTMYVDTVIVNSDIGEYLKYFANYINKRLKAFNPAVQNHTDDILSEKLHPLSKHIQFHRKPLPKKEIYRYLECLFQSADMTTENVIVCLVYLEKVVESKRLVFQPINWARLVLGAAMLAAKIWDDHAIWNIDFCQIFPEVPVADLNNLEAYFLDALQFRVNVKLSVYTKKYYALKRLTPYTNQPWSLFPLKRSELHRIERKEPPALEPPAPTDDDSLDVHSTDTQPDPLNPKRKPTRTMSAEIYTPIDRQAYINC